MGKKSVPYRRLDLIVEDISCLHRLNPKKKENEVQVGKKFKHIEIMFKGIYIMISQHVEGMGCCK